MIDFQSPATAENASHLSCDSPSPRGPNERSECRLVCCSGVGRDEGELNLRERSERHFLCLSKVQRGRPALRDADMSTHSTLSLLPPFPPVKKFTLIPVKEPKIPKLSRGSPRLAKPAQAASPGRGESQVWICTSLEPNLTYYRLISPNEGFSPEKKDCLFLWKHWMLQIRVIRGSTPLPAKADRKPIDSSLCKVKNYSPSCLPLDSAPR